MSFQIKGFATIRISSPNVKKSTEWYAQFFDQKPVEETEAFASFKIKETFFDISSADPKSPLSTGGSVGYWLVDSLDDAIGKALSLGGKIYRGPLRVDEICRTIVQIMDPCGNVIGLKAEH